MKISRTIMGLVIILLALKGFWLLVILLGALGVFRFGLYPEIIIAALLHDVVLNPDIAFVHFRVTFIAILISLLVYGIRQRLNISQVTI